MFQRSLLIFGDRALLRTNLKRKALHFTGTVCGQREVANIPPVWNRDDGNVSSPVWNVDYGGWNRDENDRHALLNLVHQGQYEKVMTVWESEKELNRADPALYTVVMAMCEHMKSAELAYAVKDDMERQKWIMEPLCCVHYIKALLSNDKVSDALEFVKSTYHPNMKDGKSFLLQSVKAFQASSHAEEAIALCDLYRSADGGGRNMELDAIRVECLGELGQAQNISLFVKENYGDISKCHQTIQVAAINGLAMTDDMESALALLKKSSNQNATKVFLKTLALLLECAVHTRLHRQGALMWHHFWEETTKLTDEEFGDASSNRSVYLLRATNAALHLQALTYRGNLVSRESSPPNKDSMEAIIEKFLKNDFYQFILEKKLVPNANTIESALLLSCFDERARETTEKVVRSVVRNGEKLDPKSFTKWARLCGEMSPFAAKKVILQVRMLVHGYSVPLGYEEIEDILNVRYLIHDDQCKLEAAKNIRIIRRIMNNNNLLDSITGWNLLLAGYLGTKVLGFVHLTLQDMTENGLKPDLSTYKTLVEGACVINEYHAYTAAIYDHWREFNKNYPVLRPDIDFLNKLLYCCRKCRHLDRAFYFLDVVEKYGLTPNMDTFREVLLMCNENNERDKFYKVLEMAYKCLPSEEMSLDALRSDCDLRWKAEIDVELATTIITDSTKKRTIHPSIDVNEELIQR